MKEIESNFSVELAVTDSLNLSMQVFCHTSLLGVCQDFDSISTLVIVSRTRPLPNHFIILVEVRIYRSLSYFSRLVVITTFQRSPCCEIGADFTLAEVFDNFDLGCLASVHERSVACDIASRIQIHTDLLNEVFYDFEAAELTRDMDRIEHVAVQVVWKHVVLLVYLDVTSPVIVLYRFY